MLFVREAGALEWRELPNTAGGTSPTFNPSGEWIAFQARGAIWKVPVSGGPALPVAEAGGAPHWGASDVIVFEENGLLYGVPGSGGAEPESYNFV